MADGPPGIRRLFTRDRHKLDNLFRRKSGWRARARGIGQSLHAHRSEHFLRAPVGFNLLQLGGQSKPALAPWVYRPAIEAHLARHVALVGSRLQRSKNLGASYQPLGTRLPARNLLQAGPLSCR
jgi:hypothetical protein